MTIDFWIGIAVIPAGMAVVLVLGWLIWASRTLWRKAHNALMARIDIAPRTSPFRPAAGTVPDSPYLAGANQMRDAVLRSPRVYQLSGLGWVLFAVRDYKASTPLATDPKAVPVIDTDAFLGD